MQILFVWFLSLYFWVKIVTLPIFQNMNEDKRPYFKVTNVPPKLHKQIKQLAKSQEMTISKFVKSELTEIIKKYPDFMKED